MYMGSRSLSIHVVDFEVGECDIQNIRGGDVNGSWKFRALMRTCTTC
jgi:hypothetical protein